MLWRCCNVANSVPLFLLFSFSFLWAILFDAWWVTCNLQSACHEEFLWNFLLFSSLYSILNDIIICWGQGHQEVCTHHALVCVGFDWCCVRYKNFMSMLRTLCSHFVPSFFSYSCAYISFSFILRVCLLDYEISVCWLCVLRWHSPHSLLQAIELSWVIGLLWL